MKKIKADYHRSVVYNKQFHRSVKHSLLAPLLVEATPTIPPEGSGVASFFEESEHLNLNR
jgi:hypothetical protein